MGLDADDLAAWAAQVALHIGGVRVPAGGLSMQAQYPVGRGDARSERDQDRFNVVGKSRHKRMVPGEKARVRAEEMAAKREMRARHKAERNEGSNTVNTAHEESLRKVVDSLNEFVARDGDLWGLPPMPAELLRQARQMASVYGLKTTVQGQGRKQVPRRLPVWKTIHHHSCFSASAISCRGAAPSLLSDLLSGHVISVLMVLTLAGVSSFCWCTKQHEQRRRRRLSWRS
jgi:hypothetical protein